MLWRLLTALIVLFWAVMTGLIIRDTYFPDQSRFAVVPVSMVFDLFLDDAAAFNNNLHLYHGQQKLGHVSFALRRLEESNAEPVYALVANGTLKVPGAGGEQNLNFRGNGLMLAAERWKQIDIEMKAPETKTEVEISWREGDKLPHLEVKKEGAVVMNTAMAQKLMESPFNSGLIAQMLPLSRLPQAGAMSFHAREGRMELAGKKRRCYIITAQLMQGYEAQLYFTEIGELARVELPAGYRLIEPMMHGLEKDLDTTF